MDISTARSALSSIISLTNSSDVSFGNLPLVFGMWVHSNYFRQIEHQDQMPVSLLGKKLALPIRLLYGGQRSQTLHSLKIEDIKIFGDKCIIPIMQKIKQTRSGEHMKPLIFRCFFARA